MKTHLFFFLILCIQTSIFAQQYNPYNHSLSPDLINTINNLLIKNNLYKDNMSAQDYNAAGIYFYEKRLWHEAELMFSMAIYKNSRHILANYNLACVYSIQLNNYYPNKDGYNEVLFQSIVPESIFYFLESSTILDPNRMVRARQDYDFNNLRKHDPELFDAITLPEEQREVYRYNVTYVSCNVFEGDIKLIFIESEYAENWQNNIERRLSFDGYQELFRNLNLYYLEGELEDEMYWVENEEMIGKKFVIEYIYTPQGNNFVGGGYIFKYMKLVSIREIL